MKKVVLIIGLFLSFVSVAQESYKYIIIPSQFSFFNEANKYGLSELTKSFFQSEGYEVYYDNEKLPDDLMKNRCLALFANAFESNTMFMTKIYFELKDCTTNTLLKSQLATSREKEYKIAYTRTFREALSSLKGKINFKKTDEIQNVEVVETPKEVVEVYKNEISTSAEATNNLFAITTANGYKLVNDKPETIFVLKKTSADNIFIALKDSKSGVLMKKTSGWFFEYYEGDKLFSEKVEVKF
ncbi:MAG: hypothetical protein L6Q46_12045 [Flavobacterium sp.]|uniref:hypothetical protein n=1 Tax=Flavobacterium sp. TaxID=239 RepID=UPI0025BE88DA|nr:hypothetical protein [Flavobacterium sp.]MCK6609011.1 hypothetical protein [Flavobacterium sp.]